MIMTTMEGTALLDSLRDLESKPWPVCSVWYKASKVPVSCSYKRCNISSIEFISEIKKKLFIKMLLVTNFHI